MMLSLRPLCINLPQVIGSNVKHFKSNKIMCFKANDTRLLKKYAKMWERVISLMNM